MPIIGLDIGRERFRAVEIDRAKGVQVLKNFGAYDGPSLDLNFTNEDLVEVYAQAVKNFIKGHHFNTSHVVVALPEQDIFLRVINTPVMEYKELKDFIALGAEEYIPIPISDVTFDVQILQGSQAQQIGNSTTMSVLLVASKNQVLAKYVDLIKRAGLTPRGIEPETLSIERILGDTSERPSASIIVHIGAMSTQLIISYKGFVQFTRSVSVGGDELTRAVQKGLGLEAVQAEEYKKAYGLDETQVEGKVYGAIKPVFDNILMEINRSKTYYTTHNPDVIINRVTLSGGTALMPGLLAYMVNKLDVEAELANPWRNIKLDEKIEHSRDALMESGPIYSTAVGLALKEV